MGGNEKCVFLILSIYSLYTVSLEKMFVSNLDGNNNVRNKLGLSCANLFSPYLLGGSGWGVNLNHIYS